jgi:hypothetical protein
MTFKELIQQQQQVICNLFDFGFHFIKENHDKYAANNPLYITHHKNSPDEPKPFLDNLIGLGGLAIREKTEIPEPFTITYYQLGGGQQLLHIEAQPREFMEYLRDEGVNLQTFIVEDFSGWII